MSKIAKDLILFLLAMAFILPSQGEIKEQTNHPILTQSEQSLDWEQTDDLTRRWTAEYERVRAETKRAQRWIHDLYFISEKWEDEKKHFELLRSLQQRSFAWQEQMSVPESHHNFEGVSWEAYQKRLQKVAEEVYSVIELGPAMRVGVNTLFAAPIQVEPELSKSDGKWTLTHEIKFSDAGRQVVFTRISLGEELALDNDRLLIRMRSSATKLHPTNPLRLRLHTLNPAGGESWADFVPEELPGKDWNEITFDLASPAHTHRFYPSRIEQIAFRFENNSDHQDNFVFEISGIRIAPPHPAIRLRQAFLQEIESQLADARNELYQLRSKISKLEDDLDAHPELRQAYFSSFEVYTDSGSKSTLGQSSGFLNQFTFDKNLLPPINLVTSSSYHGGQFSVVIEAQETDPNAEMIVELRDLSGNLKATGRGSAEELVLFPEIPQFWNPGDPCLYELRSLLIIDDQPRGYLKRIIGLRTIDRGPGGANSMLRHTRSKRQPDWNFRLNGKAFFPRVASYPISDTLFKMDDAARLFADLWVDGRRRYGFSLQPEQWEKFSRYGLGTFTSIEPPFGELNSWSDLEPFLNTFKKRISREPELFELPHHLALQIGNEVELSLWGARLSSVFTGALYQPLDAAAGTLIKAIRLNAPIMYVRSADFQKVPPLVYEDIVGINQYTGRYSGMIDEISRDLAELAKQALWADRPVMITEWMGPKYSWASTGIGGVTPRGAAYYAERYWRSMIDTPGIVGSSLFVLNWMIAPFEDLTNQTKEEAWKDRHPHLPFGGGRTADHIPLIPPGEADKSEPTFRAMQGFHSPLYLMVNRPGPITIIGEDADRIATPLRSFRGNVYSYEAVDSDNELKGHVVQLSYNSNNSHKQTCSELPVFTTTLNPADANGLKTTLRSHSNDSAQEGLERLVQAAESLAELNRLEGAMSRVLILTDQAWISLYEMDFSEFAARGYLFGGDNVRLQLDLREILTEQNNRTIPWENISAIVVDTERQLSVDEMDALEQITKGGVNLVISANSYLSNPLFTKFLAARLIPYGTLGDDLPVSETLTTPVPVFNLGLACLETIKRFRPELMDSRGLKVYSIQAEDSIALVESPEGDSIVVKRKLGKGSVTLAGIHFGDAMHIHNRVTQSGITHPFYDRDTACRLERVSRVLVNLCRLEIPEERHLPSLFVEVTPETTWIKNHSPSKLRIKIVDVHGNPVAGHLRIRYRKTAMFGGSGVISDYLDLQPKNPGVYEVIIQPSNGSESQLYNKAGNSVIYVTNPEEGNLPAILSFQLKAFAPNHIPADSGLALLIAPQ